MKENRLFDFLHNGLWLTALICAVMVGTLNIVVISEVAYDSSELVSMTICIGESFGQIILLGFLTVVCALFQEQIHRVDEKKLFRILSGIYTVFAIYLILNVGSVLRADAKAVFDGAIDIKKGIYRSLQKGNYLYRYPHQLGLVLYMQILSVFSENPMIAFIINFLMVLGINRIWWRISWMLFHDKLVSILTMVLCFSFLPQFFFILFAYSLIPGFFFLSLGFYHTIRFMETKSIANMIGLAVFTGLATLLKQNYLIGGIAVCIVLTLACFQEKNFRFPAAVFALIVCMMFPGKLIQSGYEQLSGVKLDNSIPTVLWVAMGTDIDNVKRGPGWYNQYTWMTYTEAKSNAEKATELGKEKLSENWAKIKAEPYRSVKFFLYKTTSQWCDPLFQSVWSGPLEDCGQQVHGSLLKSLYNGEEWEDKVAEFSKLLCLAIWILSVTYLVTFGTYQMGWELVFLYFIGGLLFHTVWEGKSQYTYTYVFCLIPFAAYMGRTIMRKINQ